MADLSKRGPDCGDCDGEGGERGERGKRGRRGPRGHDGHDGKDGHDGHDGATGPTGPCCTGATGPTGPNDGIVVDPTPPTLTGNGTEESPLQVINVAPQPFVVSTTTIYARIFGDDETGDGMSIATAYRTFQRAMLDVPRLIPEGERFFVDITGIGTEILPDGYVIPNQTASAPDLDFGSPYFPFVLALNIQAEPQPVSLVPASDAVLNGADFVTSLDPNTGLATLTLTGPARASWGVDGLKGKFVVGAGGGFDTGVITSNTTTAIEISIAGGAPTAPIQIMEPSATLAGDAPPPFLFRGGLSAYGPIGLGLGGIRIPQAPSGIFGAGLLMINATSMVAMLCDLENPELDFGFYILSQCYVHRVGVGGNNTSFHGGVTRITGLLEGPVTLSAMDGFSIQSSVVDGVSIDPRDFFDFIASGELGALLVLSTEFRNAPAGTRGAIVFHGGTGFLGNVNFKGNFSDDVIVFDKGQGYLELESVQGPAADNPGVAGVGIRTNDGAYVEVDGATNVAGVAGDVKSGDLPVASYGALPQFDITAVGPGGATGTGSRIY